MLPNCLATVEIENPVKYQEMGKNMEELVFEKYLDDSSRLPEFLTHLGILPGHGLIGIGKNNEEAFSLGYII